MADQLQDGGLVLPLVEERVVIGKEVVETGHVKISTHVEERTAIVHEALRHEDVVVERVPIDRQVETAPSIRREGDVVIYPIVEEVLVVEKRLILKEELRISRRVRIEEVDREVTLRSVRADVERTPAAKK